MAKKKSKKKPATQRAKKPTKTPAKLASGRGPTPAELGAKLVELFNQNKADPWIQKLWSKDVQSIEGSGDVAKGKRAILAKWEWWTNNHELLGASAEGPYVGPTSFAVRFSIHVRDKNTGKDMRMTEVAVYTVKHGQITREEFLYG